MPPLVVVTVTVTHSLAKAAALGVRADGALGVTGSSAQAPSVARPRRWKASRQRPARGLRAGLQIGQQRRHARRGQEDREPPIRQLTRQAEARRAQGGDVDGQVRAERREAQLESPGESIVAALELARAHGVATLLNPAPANSATSIELLALTDILTPNETEFAALVARHIGEKIEPDDVGITDGVSLHALCRELLAHGTVVVTLGSAGVFVSHAEEALRGDSKPHYRLAAEAAEVVDTTGAGDAFNGALAASLAGNAELAFADHVRFANRYAAVSTERAGAALSMPRLAEVRLRFPQ